MNNAADFTLAVHQHVSTPAQTENSIVRIDETAGEAASKGAQLLLVPEASLTGYNITLETAQSIAVQRDSATTERLQALCQRHKIALTYGYIERDGDTLFNAINVIDAAGENVSHYRKTHLWGGLDRSLFKPGESYSPIFELSGWKFGLLVCYDIEFPESSRHLSLQGAEVILAPTALMTPWIFVADIVTRVRAAENQVYFAYANYCGVEGELDYIGRSCIVSPDSEFLARAEDSPELLVATLSKQTIQTIRENLPYHADRRPELYRSLS